jgi:hypothetical protein
MYPEFVERVRRRIEDGKLLKKNLIEGTARRQRTPSFGCIGRGRQVVEQNNIILANMKVEGRRKTDNKSEAMVR